jgi:hypothetical protein
VELCDSDILSGFQLKDICTTKYTVEDIKAAIQEKMIESK